MAQKRLRKMIWRTGLPAKIGREVKHVNIPREAHQKAMLDLGMPAWQVNGVIECAGLHVSGRAAAVDGVVEECWVGQRGR